MSDFIAVLVISNIVVANLFYWFGSYSGRSKARMAGYKQGFNDGHAQAVFEDTQAIRGQIELAKTIGRDEARKEFIKMIVDFFEEGVAALKPQLGEQTSQLEIAKEEGEPCSN